MAEFTPIIRPSNQGPEVKEPFHEFVILSSEENNDLIEQFIADAENNEALIEANGGQPVHVSHMRDVCQWARGDLDHMEEVFFYSGVFLPVITKENLEDAMCVFKVHAAIFESITGGKDYKSMVVPLYLGNIKQAHKELNVPVSLKMIWGIEYSQEGLTNSILGRLKAQLEWCQPKKHHFQQEQHLRSIEENLKNLKKDKEYQQKIKKCQEQFSLLGKREDHEIRKGHRQSQNVTISPDGHQSRQGVHHEAAARDFPGGQSLPEIHSSLSLEADLSRLAVRDSHTNPGSTQSDTTLRKEVCTGPQVQRSPSQKPGTLMKSSPDVPIAPPNIGSNRPLHVSESPDANGAANMTNSTQQSGLNNMGSGYSFPELEPASSLSNVPIIRNSTSDLTAPKEQAMRYQFPGQRQATQGPSTPAPVVDGTSTTEYVGAQVPGLPLSSQDRRLVLERLARDTGRRPDTLNYPEQGVTFEEVPGQPGQVRLPSGNVPADNHYMQPNFGVPYTLNNMRPTPAVLPHQSRGFVDPTGMLSRFPQLSLNQYPEPMQRSEQQITPRQPQILRRQHDVLSGSRDMGVVPDSESVESLPHGSEFSADTSALSLNAEGGMVPPSNQAHSDMPGCMSETNFIRRPPSASAALFSGTFSNMTGHAVHAMRNTQGQSVLAQRLEHGAPPTFVVPIVPTTVSRRACFTGQPEYNHRTPMSRQRTPQSFPHGSDFVAEGSGLPLTPGQSLFRSSNNRQNHREARITTPGDNLEEGSGAEPDDGYVRQSSVPEPDRM